MNYIEENFHKWTPNVQRYTNGRLAVEYTSIGEGIANIPGWEESETVATINLPDEDIAPDEVIIKDYSENEGIYDMMLAAGHIGPELRRVYSGFISAPVCKLLLPH